MDLVIKGGTVVTSEETYEADIGIEGGKISVIGHGLTAPSFQDPEGEVIEAEGKYVFPGGIDVHTHMELPVLGTTSSDDFQTGSIAAACGGTTTIIDFADQVRGQSLKEALEKRLKRAQGRTAIDYALHVSITDVTEQTLREMEELVQEGVSSFKVFLAYPGRYMIDDGELLRILERAKALGALIMVHAENGYLVDYLTRKHLAKGKYEPFWHALSHPPEAEVEAAGRALSLAGAIEAPICIAHLTTAGALERVREARAKAQPAFAETCPQYLFFDVTRYRSPFLEAAKFVISPPLREKEDQEALWQGLISGALQLVSTDHCPFTLEDKGKGREDFSRIPNGLPGVESRFPLLYHFGVNRGRFSVNKFVALVATEPARLFGLAPEKGTIALGSDADLVIFDPQKEVVLTLENLHMRVDYSPYEDVGVKGYPVLVMQRGQILMKDGHFVGQASAGRFLRRKPTVV